MPGNKFLIVCAVSAGSVLAVEPAKQIAYRGIYTSDAGDQWGGRAIGAGIQRSKEQLPG